eukprot:gene10431-biopygen16787
MGGVARQPVVVPFGWCGAGLAVRVLARASGVRGPNRRRSQPTPTRLQPATAVHFGDPAPCGAAKQGETAADVDRTRSRPHGKMYRNGDGPDVDRTQAVPFLPTPLKGSAPTGFAEGAQVGSGQVEARVGGSQICGAWGGLIGSQVQPTTRLPRVRLALKTTRRRFARWMDLWIY